MSDDTTTGTAAETSGDGDEQVSATETDETLGDSGKKAIESMKAELSKAKAELGELRAINGDKRGLDRLKQQARDEVQAKIRELEEFKAKAEGREVEYKAQQEAQSLRDEFLAKANERIIGAELRAAAKGKVSEDVLGDLGLFIKPSDFEVGDDGSVNTDAIAQAIDDLITRKPSLAAQSGKKFQGTADGGARNGSATSLDDQIADATKAGNLQLAISLKQQRSAELLAKRS